MCIHSLDWTTGLSSFPLFGQVYVFINFVEINLLFYNQQVPGWLQ